MEGPPREKATKWPPLIKPTLTLLRSRLPSHSFPYHSPFPAARARNILP